MEFIMSELEHYDREIYELDERIGRLALICGADLSRSSVLVGLVKGQFDVCTHQKDLSKPKLMELRGLLMIKHKVEEECINDFGLEYFNRLLADQDLRLSNRGFSPGTLTDIK